MSSPHSEEPATFVTAPGDRSVSRRNGRKPGRVAKRQGDALGVVTRGSLVEGLEMKLDPARNVEDMKAGKFVVIEGVPLFTAPSVNNTSGYCPFH